MEISGSRFWWYWLIVATLGVMIFSLSMFLLPNLSQMFFNWLIFQNIASPFEAGPTHYIVFICSIYGVAIMSWMLILLSIIAIPFRKGELWAWWAVALSIGIWFVVDSTLSLIASFQANITLNAAIFVFFVFPLIATYTQFHHPAAHILREK